MSSILYGRRYDLPHIVSKVNSKPYKRCIHDVVCWLVDVELRGPDNKPIPRTLVSFSKQGAKSYKPGKEYWL